MTAAAWCVVISKPMSEHIAAASICAAGYRHYLPMEQRILRGHRESKGTPKLYPLFPRYLFAELHDGQDWGPVRRAKGVQDVIRCGERLSLVSAGIVDAIRDAENAGEFSERLPEMPAWVQPGASAKAVVGPFASFIGRIRSTKPDGRVSVLFEVFGRATPVEMRAEELAEMRA